MSLQPPPKHLLPFGITIKEAYRGDGWEVEHLIGPFREMKEQNDDAAILRGEVAPEFPIPGTPMMQGQELSVRVNAEFGCGLFMDGREVAPLSDKQTKRYGTPYMQGAGLAGWNCVFSVWPLKAPSPAGGGGKWWGDGFRYRAVARYDYTEEVQAALEAFEESGKGAGEAQASPAASPFQALAARQRGEAAPISKPAPPVEQDEAPF